MLNKIIEKIFSGRFIATVAIVITYCQIVGSCAGSYIKAISSNPERMESFVVGLIMGFSGIATLVIKAYFDRTDRKQEQGS